MKSIIAWSRKLLLPIMGAGETLLLLFRTILYFPSIWFKRQEIVRQMYIAGFKSLFVVSVVATFTGMIFSLQTGLALKDFGQQDLIGQVIVVTLTREMSPFMTALILAASVGSAIAAEVATMTVSEEIDALEVMSIDPVRYLVLPRIVGFSLMVPILSIYGTALGILGGGLVAQTQLGVDYPIYFQSVHDALLTRTGLKDIWVGQFKALVFGITISTISCRQGLAATGGAIGVGIAVRQAVVVSFLFVIILGYFITATFYR
ncbi:MAG: ABC transporter permease [Leptospirales bacterium]|nr:ABC transporter permease [Leptospirales bacterium]